MRSFCVAAFASLLPLAAHAAFWAAPQTIYSYQVDATVRVKDKTTMRTAEDTQVSTLQAPLRFTGTVELGAPDNIMMTSKGNYSGYANVGALGLTASYSGQTETQPMFATGVGGTGHMTVGFQDSVTFSSSQIPAGFPMFINAKLRLTGSMNMQAGRAEIKVSGDGTGANNASTAWVFDCGEDGGYTCSTFNPATGGLTRYGVTDPVVQFNQDIPIRLLVNPGQPIDLAYALSLKTSGMAAKPACATFGGLCAVYQQADFSGLIDFSHTLSWGGISSVTDYGGAPVSNYTLSSQSGFDYRLAYSAAPVPEPQTYGLLLAGLAVIGQLARRRRSAHQAHPFFK